jgi:hypothetical protein
MRPAALPLSPASFLLASAFLALAQRADAHGGGHSHGENYDAHGATDDASMSYAERHVRPRLANTPLRWAGPRADDPLCPASPRTPARARVRPLSPLPSLSSLDARRAPHVRPFSRMLSRQTRLTSHLCLPAYSAMRLTRSPCASRPVNCSLTLSRARRGAAAFGPTDRMPC